MAPISVTEQMRVLTSQLEKATGKTDELLSGAVGYVRQYADAASPEAVSEVLSIIERKYGIKPADVLSDARPATEEPFISDVYPTTGWLGEYLQFTLGHEAPDIFHFWVGVSVLQSVIRRNIYFEHGYYRIYPNAYIILVAPPGRCRKSTAMDIGVGMLTQLEDVNVIREKVTPEALVKSLSTQPTAHGEVGAIIVETASAALLYASELTVFLGREKYNEGLIALLTTLFDCHARWESNTIGRGKTVLTNVHLGLLGGITPELIASSIPEIALGGGFVSRTIFIVRERTPRCFSEPRPRDPLLREKLIAGLSRLSGIRTGIVQTAAAYAWMEDWYKKQYMRQDAEISLSGYYERKQSHLIKLAMTLLISEGVPDALVTPELYENALRILETAEKTMPLALEKVHSSEIGRFHDLVIELIKKGKGRLTHSELLRRVYGRMDADRLKKIIVTLQEAGMVTSETNITGKGRGTTVYTLTRGAFK